MSKQFFFIVMCMFLCTPYIHAYTAEELDRFAERGERYVRSILKMRQTSGDIKGAQQLEQLIAERFSGGGRLSAGQIALQAAPAGLTYIAVPTELAQQYQEKGLSGLAPIAQEGGVTLSQIAPTDVQQSQKPPELSGGTWWWHTKLGKWVFVSSEPFAIAKPATPTPVPAVETPKPSVLPEIPAVVPTTPIKPTPSEHAAPIVPPAAPPAPQLPEPPPAPTKPTAPETPAAPLEPKPAVIVGLPAAPPPPAAPPVPEAPPVVNPAVPSAPPAPPIPGAPPAPAAPPIPGAPPVSGVPNKGQASTKPPVKKLLTQEESAALPADKKQLSDQIYTDLIVKVSKQFPAKEKLNTKEYGVMVRDAVKKLKSTDGFVRTQTVRKGRSGDETADTLDILDKNIQSFFDDKAFNDFDNMLKNVGGLTQKASDLFKSVLLNAPTQEFNDAIERLVIGGFGVARMAAQEAAKKKFGQNEQIISDNIAFGAVKEADAVDSLRKAMLRLIIDPRFVHYEPLLKSWNYDPAEKTGQVEQLKINAGSGIALKVLADEPMVIKLRPAILSLNVWNNLFYEPFNAQDELSKAAMDHLNSIMEPYKKEVEERSRLAAPVPAPAQGAAAAAVNRNNELRSMWPQITNLIELKNALKDLSKKVIRKGPQSATNDMVELLENNPQSPEIRELFVLVFEDKKNQEKFDQLYDSMKVYFEIRTAMEIAKKVALEKREEANKLDAKGGKENEAQAFLIRQEVFKGAWLYAELTKIFKKYYWDTYFMFNHVLDDSIAWNLPAIDKLAKSIAGLPDKTDGERDLKQRLTNRVTLLRSTVINARNNSLQQVFTSLYRTVDDVYGAFSEFFTKGYISSFSKLGFDKSYFLIILEPYGLVLKIISEFNAAQPTVENYTMLLKSLEALDKSTPVNILTNKKDEYFTAISTARQEIAPPTSLYKGRLTEMIKGLKESNFVVVKQQIDRLVAKAGVGIEEKPEYKKLLDAFQPQLLSIFRANIIEILDSLNKGARALDLTAVGVPFKSKVTVVQAYVGQALIGVLAPLIKSIQSKKNIEDLDFATLDAEIGKVRDALHNAVVSGLQKAGEQLSEEQVKTIVTLIIDKEVMAVRQRLADLYKTVTGKAAPSV